MKEKKNKLPEPVKIKIPEPSRIDRQNPIDLATAKALATSEKLSKITTLDLTDSPIGAEGLAAILSSPHLKGLYRLYLGNTQIGDEGCKVLATAPLKGLSDLKVDRNKIGPEGARALSEAPWIGKLLTFDASENPLKDEGVSLLFPTLREVTEANFSWCSMGAVGAKAFAQSILSKKVRSLFASHNSLALDGVKALSQSSCSRLEILALGWCGIDDAGAASIASASWAASLTFLDLRGNQISDVGATALSESKMLNLAHLQLRHNPLSPKAEKALLRALPLVKTLQLGPLPEGTVFLCPYCSSKADEAQPRCPACQLDITRDAGTVLTLAQYKQERRTTCHHCGAQRFETALVCPTCKRWGISS